MIKQNIETMYQRALGVFGEDAFGPDSYNKPHMVSMIDRQGRYMELGWIPLHMIRHIPAAPQATSSRIALTVIPLEARNLFDRFQYLEIGRSVFIARTNDADWMKPRPFRQFRVADEAPNFRRVPSDDFDFCLRRHLLGAAVLHKEAGGAVLDNLRELTYDPDWLVKHREYVLSVAQDPDLIVGRFLGLPDFADGYTTASFRFDFWRS